MVSLADLVEVSKKIGSTTRKKEKISLLALFLKQGRGREITLAACYLSGIIPQGRLGIGWTTLQEALKDLPSRFRSLSLVELDHLLEAISRERGTGSLERKTGLLRDLFSYTRKDETEFLARLMTGEIRQGAPAILGDWL